MYSTAAGVLLVFCECDESCFCSVDAVNYIRVKYRAFNLLLESELPISGIDDECIL